MRPTELRNATGHLVAGGQGATGMRAAYAWDAENRLISVTPTAPQAGDKKLVFAYDYLGRRIRKQVFDWDDQAAGWQATPSVQRKFVWGGTDAGGWLLLMELDGSDNVVRKYAWGLDLAGQHGSVNSLESAGGIGGLLAVAQAQVGGGSASGGIDAGEYVFTYDANGNVAQVLDLSAGSAAAAIVAHYEYDPYGGVVNNLSGYTYAEANPIRFSRKYWDAETGLGYWGYRYYSARLGRWLSRDPIGEAGGTHLYAYVFNQPTVSHDALGLCLCGKEDCRKKLGEALEDPRIKKMVEEARKLKHWWGMPCFGRVRCTCVCPKDMGGWADPISGDALVCATQTHCMTRAQFNDVVREEIAHHMLMCGNINDWLWRCRGCMREEKRAKYLAGLCRTNEECTRKAWYSCSFHLGCRGKSSGDFLNVGWPPDLKGHEPF